jgi:RHS repeat-associated protein
MAEERDIPGAPRPSSSGASTPSDAREDGPPSGGGQQGPLPSLSLPKGGGAIRGIGEKFATNPVTGTASFSVPLPTSPGRAGATPQLSLSYDAGAGNGVFGWGFGLGLPVLTRKTDKGLPQYRDAEDSDTFILSGAEDLVPVPAADKPRTLADGTSYLIRRYRPRVEGLFSRIERWTDTATGIAHWRSISKDNITTTYGSSDESRIFDPADATRVFSWLIDESRDDKGNVTSYGYKIEDTANVDASASEESHRLVPGSFCNRHIKEIRYGNPVPFVAKDWLFTVVFDYGEHDDTLPTPTDPGVWPVRKDPFSNYRPGFEMRTYRLCRRVLMFHLFPHELPNDATLVRSLDLDYGGGSPIASFVQKITLEGYLLSADKKSYQSKPYPPVELHYTEAVIDETVRELDTGSLENLPDGLGAGYQWVDLFKEGLSGVLTQQAGAWFYKPNLGDGTFGAVQALSSTPAIADLNRGRQQILDLDGDERDALVEFQPPISGFHRLEGDGRWASFVPFARSPSIDWNDPNLRFIDLTGDGRADLLITENEAFTWYPSLGSEGFGPSARVPAAFDEKLGPRLVFSHTTDGTEAIYLADMSGDGLSDLVRIRNGEVCYWPNLGYGRFGARVLMSGTMPFDRADSFSQKRIRLADVDGSGTTDILYLGAEGVRIYFNQSGNSLGAPRVLGRLPRIDDETSVAALDLLGNGTACLVWSSSLPADSQRPLQYVDLMGGQKPHLLRHIVNNLGAETYIGYAPSTRFYIADRRAGLSWITKLPFPVQCVERVETWDAVGQTRFVTRYAYHHGHYDGVEREFRGFGMVEQRDTEALAVLQEGAFVPAADNDSDPASHVPPVRTMTWFHTGSYVQGGPVTRQYMREYWRADGQSDSDSQSLLLDDTLLPPNLTAEEEREACRALKGGILRQEVYAEDDSLKAGIPYSVVERNYTIEPPIQSRGKNRYAVFFVHPRESVSYHYERNPDDARIVHELTLAVDDFGNVTRAASIAYGRRADKALPGDDGTRQQQLLCTLAENDFTANVIDEDDAYRARMPTESRSYELSGLSATTRLTFEDVNTATHSATELAYEASPTSGFEKRLIDRQRTLYRKNDLTGPASFGTVESMALPYESYKLAFTPGLLQQVYGARVTSTMLATDGAYVQADGANWWIPSGQAFYSQGETDLPNVELANAQNHFFQPWRARDPFGKSTFITYDNYDLLPREIKDALTNLTTAINDYRVLQPWQVLDANRNRLAVTFDELGLVVATAVMGKEGAGEGDTLDDPTTKLEYDLLAWKNGGTPAVVHTYAREKHGSANPRWQESYSYSDGFGREIQKKIQAEPGPLVDNGPDVNPRWVGSGWTIFNNKGKPVRKYEPFFTATADFEFAKTVGVSPILFYDPLVRVVGTLSPNHTWEKVVFDPWQQQTFDANDTALVANPKDDLDVGDYFGRLPDADYLPTWYSPRQSGSLGPREEDAATKTEPHHDTPTTAHFDSLGRAFLTIADNGADGQYATRVELDIEGNQRSVTDAKNRVVARYDYDLLKRRLHQASMEAGERWMLADVGGKPIYAEDSRGHQFRTEYDVLRRPVRQFVRGTDATRSDPRTLNVDVLFQKSDYGEGQPNDVTLNLRTRVFRQYDAAGIVTNEQYDFKGNVLSSNRALAREYQAILDWSGAVPTDDVFENSTTWDALNRPVTLTTPDKTVLIPTYNEANLLERLDGYLKGAATITNFITNLDYNARGQRVLCAYAKAATTTYHYDPFTFRLIELDTTGQLQALKYTYDPVGNLTFIEDDAQQTIYFMNQRIEPHNDYTYDAIYRLKAAIGREHLGQVGNPPVPTSATDAPRVNVQHRANGQAMGRYLQQYVYDEVGNLQQMIHQGTDPVNRGWTRTYQYNEQSQIDPGQISNRLTSTTAGGLTESYSHDAHGNLTFMPPLPTLKWDYKDQLLVSSPQVVNTGTPETTYYVYDAGGQRVRKVTELASGMRKSERIYLGGFEIYRHYDGSENVDIERETLHVMDDQQRVALVETRTQGTDDGLANLTRYQLGNHLGSAVLELDDSGQIISYEEYYPYGSTSYQGVRNQLETPKRYRYTGNERDEETGLSYHGARYYAPWLGRWTSCDPAGMVDGANLYEFVRGNPIEHSDPTGLETKSESELPHLELREPALGNPGPKWGLPGLSEGRSYSHDIIDRALQESPTPVQPGFWHRGGGTLTGGLLSFGVGVLILSNPVGWFGGLVGALALGGGVGGTVFGGVHLGASYSGHSTPQNDLLASRGAGIVLGLTSPGGIGGGLIGAGIAGDEGLETGAYLGNLAEAGATAAYGLGKLASREFRFGLPRIPKGSLVRDPSWDAVQPALQDVFGGPGSRPNPAFPGGVERLDLSHWPVPRRWFNGTRWAEFIFNRPWNLRQLWASEHALVDPWRLRFVRQPRKAALQAQQLSGLPRHLLIAPEWLLQSEIAGLQAGAAVTARSLEHQ